MKKFILIITILMSIYSLKSQIKSTYPNDTIRYKKILDNLYLRNNEKATDELKKIVDKPIKHDEAYFYFFKGIISFYKWQNEDSIHGMGRPHFLDTAASCFQRAHKINSNIYFQKLYLTNSQVGFDSVIFYMSSNAKAKYLRKNYSAALADYERLLFYKRDNSFVTAAGLSALMLTSYYKALNYFQEAITLNKNDFKNWIYIVETYIKLNDTTNALKYAFDASLLFPNNNNIILQEYDIYKMANLKDSINSSIKKIEKLSNKDVKIYNILGIYYHDNKRLEDAEKMYLQSFELNKNQDNLLFNIIVLYYNKYLEKLQQVQRNYKSTSKEYYYSILENERNFLLSKKFIDIYQKTDNKQNSIYYILAEFENVLGNYDKMNEYLNLINDK